MTQKPIRVDIVAPAYNRREITLQCIKSLLKIDSTGLDVHIVIVDDGSTDGTGDAIRQEYPVVEVIDGNGGLLYTEGTNVGVRAALKHDPQYVLMINDDALFDPDFLQHMVRTAERNPRSVVGSLLLLWDTPHKLFQTAPVWKTWSGGWRHWYHQTVWTVPDKPWNVDLIVGNCVLVPIEAIRKHGLMNSRRYPFFGDAEYTPRLKRAGWQLLIEPRARVFCQPNYLPPRVREKGLYLMFNDLAIDLRNSHNLRRRLYANLDSAPSKIHGLVAFCSFFVRAVLGRSPENQKFAESQSEPPLKETFASAIVDD